MASILCSTGSVAQPSTQPKLAIVLVSVVLCKYKSCHLSFILSFACLMKPVMGETLHRLTNVSWCARSSKEGSSCYQLSMPINFHENNMYRLHLMDHCKVAVVKVFCTQHTCTWCILNTLIASETKYQIHFN